MPDSVFRLQRADRRLDRADPFDPKTWEDLLGDHADHPKGICCHPDPAAIPAEQGATILSLVMDLSALTMRLAEGRPCETGYRTVEHARFLAASS